MKSIKSFKDKELQKETFTKIVGGLAALIDDGCTCTQHDDHWHYDD